MYKEKHVCPGVTSSWTNWSVVVALILQFLSVKLGKGSSFLTVYHGPAVGPFEALHDFSTCPRVLGKK